MAPDKHPNDDYINPTTATAAAPVPPSVRPDDRREQLEAEDAAAQKAVGQAAKSGEPATAEQLGEPASADLATESTSGSSSRGSRK
jgi:hypothetical protein